MVSEPIALAVVFYIFVAGRAFTALWAEPRYDTLATSVAIAVAWLPYSIYIALVNRG